MFKMGLMAAGMLAMCGSAMAQGYVGVAGGVSHFNMDCTGVSSCDKNDAAVKLTGGYSFGNGFAAELGLASFGKVKASESSVSLNLKASAPTLSVKYQYQINPNWGSSLHLGVARMKATLSGTVVGIGSSSQSETHSVPYYGVAMNYMATKNLKIEAGLDFSKVEFLGDKANLRAVTLGAAYAF